MYCWNCGHKNADDNKFCGECGKTLLVPEVPPARRSTAIGSINAPRPDSEVAKEPQKKEVSAVKVSADQREPVTAPAINDTSKPAAGMRPAETATTSRTTTKLTNPLVEEPRIVRETLSPVPSSPTPVEVPALRPAEEQRTAREKIPPMRSNSLAQDFPQVRRVPDMRTAAPGIGANAATLGANRISGPSFLGLSDEPRIAEDSNYLLDDEESSSSWRGYLALAFLLILGVLVLRQWTEMRGIAADFAQRLGIGDAPKRVKAQPTVSSSENQAGQSASQGQPTGAAGENVNPTSTPHENATTPPQEVAKAKPSESLAGGKPENDDASNESAKAAKSKTKATDESANEEDADTAPAEPAKTSAKSAKASAAAAPTYDNSQVDMAQKYLQGKGVPQNCSRGVSLLRSAARQANPKARIQMAALYLSGHCVEQNLPQAYNWFAQAQELEPNNAWIERNLNTLWSKMTDEERRRVLR